MKKIIGLLILLFITQYSVHAQDEEHRGSGDDVITITKPNPDEPALLRISGNDSESHFSVTGYNDYGNETELLVNTTSNYNGLVPLDLGETHQTTKLEVSAEGSWTITVYDIEAAPIINVPGGMTGNGDSVLWVTGSPTIMSMKGNQEGNHFSATAYDEYGDPVKLLVNTTEYYDGTVIIPSNTQIIEVTSTGEWSIDIE